MNFIEVFDNALSSEDCKYIIDFMNTDAGYVTKIYLYTVLKIGVYTVLKI